MNTLVEIFFEQEQEKLAALKQRRREAMKRVNDRDEAGAAIAEKTARLRALRLATEAANAAKRKKV
jgi:hypothetical protein